QAIYLDHSRRSPSRIWPQERSTISPQLSNIPAQAIGSDPFPRQGLRRPIWGCRSSSPTQICRTCKRRSEPFCVMNTFPLACPADSVLLDEAIARFKTPGIRDLDHSAPYIHNSKLATLDNAVGFYLGSSSSARAGTLRNGANALKGITLLPADISPHVAFLKSLNED